jgi:hypothetical protein
MNYFPTLTELMRCYDSLSTTDSGISPLDIELLHKHIKAQGSMPGSMLEVGFCNGVSAAILSQMSAKGIYYSIDPYYKEFFKSEETPEEFVQRKANRRLVLIEEESAVALPTLFLGGFKPSFIFIDGSHIFDAKFVDVYWANRLADTNCLVAIHDPWLPQTMQILSYVESNYLHWELLEKNESIAIFKIGEEEDKPWDFHKVF